MFFISRLAFLSIGICTLAIKNIRNMHAVSTNQVADILHFNYINEILLCIAYVTMDICDYCQICL